MSINSIVSKVLKYTLIHLPPRLLDIASFVLDIGTTSLAHTYPATTHNSTTNPIPIKKDESGATASNT